MKKGILGLFFITFFVLILASCSSQEQTTLSNKEQDKSISKTSNTKPIGDASTDNEVGEITEEDTSGERATDTVRAEPTNEPASDTTGKEPANEPAKGMFLDDVYINKRLNFSLELPGSWNGMVMAEEGSWTTDVDHIIDFYYTPQYESIKQNIFSVLVFEEEIEHIDWDDRFPIWIFIESGDGKTFAYATPAEPNPELLDSNNSNHLEMIQKMIYDELPDVIRSFEVLD